MNIVTQFQIDGIHRWADCPFEEVDFLRSHHRHMFHIRCEKKVNHDDRDRELIMFKKDIMEYLEEEYYDVAHRTHFFDKMSCEQIARELYNRFDLSMCEVMEDGENGAIYRGVEGW